MENRELTELDAAPPAVLRRAPAALESIFPSLCALPRQPPRREMLPGLGWKSVVNPGMLSFFPMLAFFLIFPFFIAAQMKKQAVPRPTATARVVQVERFGAEQIFVKYRFDVGGRAYNGGTAGLANSPLSLLKLGSPLEVVFERDKPQQSVPTFERTALGTPAEIPWPFLVVFPLIAFVAVSLFFVPQLKSLLATRRLFSSGVLTNRPLA